MTLDELIERIEKVTAEELTELANEFFQTESIAVTVLGNLNGLKLTRDQLACCFNFKPRRDRCPHRPASKLR